MTCGHHMVYVCTVAHILYTVIYIILYIFRYLDRKKVVVAGDAATYEYRWGARAQHEITKRDVLQMVATVRIE